MGAANSSQSKDQASSAAVEISAPVSRIQVQALSEEPVTISGGTEIKICNSFPESIPEGEYYLMILSPQHLGMLKAPGNSFELRISDEQISFTESMTVVHRQASATIFSMMISAASRFSDKSRNQKTALEKLMKIIREHLSGAQKISYTTLMLDPIFESEGYQFDAETVGMIYGFYLKTTAIPEAIYPKICFIVSEAEAQDFIKGYENFLVDPLSEKSLLEFLTTKIHIDQLAEDDICYPMGEIVEQAKFSSDISYIALSLNERVYQLDFFIGSKVEEIFSCVAQVPRSKMFQGGDDEFKLLLRFFYLVVAGFPADLRIFREQLNTSSESESSDIAPPPLSSFMVTTIQNMQGFVFLYNALPPKERAELILGLPEAYRKIFLSGLLERVKPVSEIKITLDLEECSVELFPEFTHQGKVLQGYYGPGTHEVAVLDEGSASALMEVSMRQTFVSNLSIMLSPVLPRSPLPDPHTPEKLAGLRATTELFSPVPFRVDASCEELSAGETSGISADSSFGPFAEEKDEKIAGRDLPPLEDSYAFLDISDGNIPKLTIGNLDAIAESFHESLPPPRVVLPGRATSIFRLVNLETKVVTECVHGVQKFIAECEEIIGTKPNSVQQQLYVLKFSNAYLPFVEEVLRVACRSLPICKLEREADGVSFYCEAFGLNKEYKQVHACLNEALEIAKQQLQEFRSGSYVGDFRLPEDHELANTSVISSSRENSFLHL